MTFKYLVTGGAGFLGSNLISKLLEKNCEIICFDNEFRGKFTDLPESERINIVKGDITNYSEWEKLDKDLAGIFHLAAINGTHLFYSIPDKVLNVNVKGTINALEFTKNNKIPYFSFASSPEAYGIPSKFPTTEETPLLIPNITNPRWSYGASKIIGEIYCANYSSKFNFKCSIIRYHNTYGPNDFSGHVIPDLINKIIKNKELDVEGTGDETRSFSYVTDVIDATLLILEKQEKKLDVFNVGIDRETNIKNLIKILQQISGKKLNPIFRELKNPGTARRLPEISKIRNLGYKPKINLEEGLKKTYQWHMDNHLEK